MRRLKFGALALFAVAAVYAVSASAAFAKAEYKNETKSTTPREKNTSTWESALSSIEGKLTSTELEAETSPINKEEGNETIKFYSTKSTILGLEGSCHTAGEGAGTVKVAGKYHLEESTTKTAALALITLAEPGVEITCGSASDPELTVKGSVLGVLTPTGKSTKEYYLEVKGTKGKQAITEYLENGTTNKRTAGLYTLEATTGTTKNLSDQNEELNALLLTASENELELT